MGGRKAPAPPGTAGENAHRTPWQRHLLAFLAVVAQKLLAFAVFLLIFFKVMFGVVAVPDGAMSPSFKEGDIAFCYKFAKDYEKDDVIVVRVSYTDPATGEVKRETEVRRVLAVEGDVVDITADQGLRINGFRQEEKEVHTETFPVRGSGVQFPVRVGKGEVFVLGDDRTSAADSRIYGPVEIGKTDGRVVTMIRRLVGFGEIASVLKEHF